MLRRILAAVSALMLAFGVTSVVGASASAHTGDLDATAVCQKDGTYLVTYTLKISNTGYSGTTWWRVGDNNFDGTPTSKSGMDRGPVASSGEGTITLGTTTVPGNATKAPWAYAYTKWSDGYTKGSDGGDIKLAGTCKAPSTKVVPIAPTIVDACGTANDSVTPPADTANITYSVGNDGYVYATLKGSNVKWGSHPGWTETSSGKLKYNSIPSDDPCEYTQTVCWLLDDYKGGDTQPPAGAKGTFPQKLVDCDDVIPCGKWIQKDIYTIDSVADEALLNDLLTKGVLKYGPYGPEDSSIYTSHTFIQGQKCRPNQPPDNHGTKTWDTQECTTPLDGTATVTTHSQNWTTTFTWDDSKGEWVEGAKKYGAVTTTTKTVDDDSCAPPPPVDVCPNLVGDQSQVPDGWSVDNQGNCFHEETVCWLMDSYNGGSTQPAAGTEGTFPQKLIDCDDTIPCGTWTQTDTYHVDSDVDEALYKSLLSKGTLEFVNGLPEDSSIYKSHVFTYGGDCAPVCTIGDASYEQGDTLPDHYTWVQDGPCQYTEPLCVYGDTGYWSADDLPEGVIYDEAANTCRGVTEPTLEATLVPMCISNVPFVDYTATLTDPDGQASQNDHVTFTFLNKSGNGDPDWTSSELPLTDNHDGTFSGSGTFAWPFASFTGSLSDPDSIVGTGWPGWQVDSDDTWTKTEDGHNGGWTVDGVDVLAKVNPEYMISGVEYPAATFPCVPEEISKELDAPPAKPVEAEAQYAG